MFKVFSLIPPIKSAQSMTARKSLVFLSVPLFMLAPMQVNAACKNKSCACQPSEIQFASPTLERNRDGQYPIVLEADDVASEGDDVVTLTGQAEVSQGRQTIVADKLQYFRETERIVANGNIEMISANGDYLSAQDIDVVTSTQIGTLSDAKFKLAKGISSQDGVDTVQIDSRGSAKVINLEGEGLLRLENTSYTNCREGDNSVVVSAKELKLDQLAGIGTARNATIRFKGVPIFYTPYLSFPINDERKTGFLTPGFGSDEESGNIIELPWYWNIAKNQDATITPRFYTDRGAQLGAEYRHRSYTSSTYFYGEILPDDDLFGDDRSLIKFQHSQQFTESLSARINYNDVSDVDYFDDLSNDLDLFSSTFVPRDVQVDYATQLLSVSARVNEFEVVDPDIALTNLPYERLPSINFATSLPKTESGWRYGVSGSYTDFASDFRVEGQRTAITPYVEKSFDAVWGYVRPALSVNYRDYSLENLAPIQESDPSFTVPSLTLDAGLFFEKDINWFGSNAQQTLEPRIFYAYAPDEDQSDVPLFDTSIVSGNNFNNIFRENRFFGQDRFGDNNQVTLGLTSRIINNQTGNEVVKASIGQVYYFDDLEQNLVPGQTIDSGVGDFLAELKTQGSGDWATYSFVQYDHQENELRSARFDLAYAPRNNNRKRVSLGYFFSDLGTIEVDQLTLNIDWPISDRWQFTASERYSIEDSESLFRDVGIEYDSCCWKLRLRAQERISNRDIDDKRTAVFLELELTSLGSISSGL